MFTPQDVLGDLLQGRKELSVDDHAVFDHLGEAAPQFAGWQSAQVLGINPDTCGLMKRPDHILRTGMINPDFAADRAIDLGKQVVGTMMSGSPRAYVAATKPARSPITPPPNPTISVWRSAGAAPARRKAAMPARAISLLHLPVR